MAKGSMSDFFYIATILPILAVVIIITTYMVNLITPEIKNVVTSNTSIEIIGSTIQAFSAWDPIFIMIAVGAPIVELVLAFQVRTHPAFYFVGILLFVILLSLTPLYSNIVRSVASNEVFSGIIDTLPMMSTVFENYTLFILGIGIFGSIVIYARRSDEQI